jgi:hypothetical protein
MTRSETLLSLVENGQSYDTARLGGVAAELGLPLADVLVVGGHPVPGELLPPVRDAEVARAFVYRATHCNHPQLAALTNFLEAMPDEAVSRPARAAVDGFPAVLAGLMSNRGLDWRLFPFVGLSRSTVHGLVAGAWHRLSQLQAVAGPLGWRPEDLAVLAGEPVTPLEYGPWFCHHLGAVFLAAVRRTSGQLAQAAREADRLSARVDQGGWQPFAVGTGDCPDALQR